jgi:dual specificity phosphatase 12
MDAPAHEIIPRLWLGNRKAAVDDPEWIKDHGVTAVFNCTKQIPFSAAVQRKYRVPVDDNLQPIEIQHMGDWAAETQLKLSREYREGRTVLVHCHAGMQRSAAVVAMFLMLLYGWPAEKAMAYIKERRSIAFFPAANFEPAIERWEAELRKHGRIVDSV